ncbi:hypothetical protein [Catellatospora sp. TT07R-123]|uniref:hypothetical protein n=1 Tax=Catellatospora sp. TT07R-123 TaxID=2733863 RepID=UPI001BB2F948|nr:hypothetical protein [Catellatospora sp. TT07R-123]
MGIDVILARRTRTGTGPRRAEVKEVDFVAASGDVVERILAAVWDSGRTPMLDRADPVGDLILTSAEMDQLRAELEILREAVPARDVSVVEAMLRLARLCQEHPDLEIWFQGD